MSASASHSGLWRVHPLCTLLALKALLLLAGGPAYGATRGSERMLDEGMGATTGATHGSDHPSRISIRSGHRLRDYYVFVPASIAPDTPAPVLLLLHGSYQSPLDVLPQWTEVAECAGVILAAPLHDDTPALMRDIVDDLATRRSIDRRRLYLFGHSAGGVHALMLGLLESQYFAAVAVHAAAWTQRDYFNAIPLARRKIPVWMTIGDQDRFFAMKDVTATEAALRNAGFPVTLTIIKGHDHSYTDVAPSVNRTAWEFFEPIGLAQAPVFAPYE